MVLGILALLISFCISAIAIYFSVTGWVALFSGAAFGVSLMFGSIEIGKLIAAGFLHWHWKKLPGIHRGVLLSMVFVTMLLTSIGVFGFLSKAHLDQENPATTASLQIERIDQRIASNERRIKDATSQLDQLDKIIQTLIDYDKISDPENGAVARRAQQAPQRELLAGIIDDSMTEIDKLQSQKLEYQQEVNEVKAKLGPLTYVIDLFNFDNKDFAVQLVILFSIFVFDPFAIALLLAGLWSIKMAQPTKTLTTPNESVIIPSVFVDEPVAEEDPLAMSEQQKEEMENITKEMHQEAKEVLDSREKTSKIKNIEEIKQMLAEQPELVDEVQEKLQKDDPELAAEMEETFQQVANENRIRKSGFLDSINFLNRNDKNK